MKSYYKSLYSGKELTYKGIVFKSKNGTNFLVHVFLPEPLGNFTTGTIISCIALGVSSLTLTEEYYKDTNGYSFGVSNMNLSVGQICSIKANFVWK